MVVKIGFIQPDQINMAVLFWYLVESDLSSVGYCTEAYTRQVTVYKVPEKHGHV